VNLVKDNSSIIIAQPDIFDMQSTHTMNDIRQTSDKTHIVAINSKFPHTVYCLQIN